MCVYINDTSHIPRNGKMPVHTVIRKGHLGALYLHHCSWVQLIPPQSHVCFSCGSAYRLKIWQFNICFMPCPLPTEIYSLKLINGISEIMNSQKSAMLHWETFFSYGWTIFTYSLQVNKTLSLQNMYQSNPSHSRNSSSAGNSLVLFYFAVLDVFGLQQQDRWCVDITPSMTLHGGEDCESASISSIALLALH